MNNEKYSNIMFKHIPSGCINLSSYKKEKEAIVNAMKEATEEATRYRIQRKEILREFSKRFGHKMINQKPKRTK